MYKVLLVDDEEHDLEGLRRLVPWSEAGMEVAGAFNTPGAAIKFAAEHHVDVLVSDIKMPRMSGLDMARHILEFLPNVKIVFVSGYADFHYAQNAIKINACGYVLKPVDEDELLALLQSVRCDLDSSEEQSRVQSAVQELVPQMKNETLLKWLEGAGSLDSLQPLLNRYGIDSADRSRCAVVIEIDDVAWKLNRANETERLLVLDAIQKRVLDTVQRDQIGYFCRINDYQVAIISEEEDRGLLVRQLEKLVEEVRRHEPLSITAGLGKEQSRSEKLAVSYKQAREALASKVFMGKSRVIEQLQLAEEESRHARHFDKIMDDLLHAMVQYELVRIDDCLIELFAMVRPIRDKAKAYQFVLHIVSKLDLYLHKMNENMHAILGWENENLDALFHLETVEDMRSWLRRRMFEISEHFHNRKSKRHYKLMQDIDKYVEERLSGELMLRDVAQAFAFSPGYFSALFKEEMGVTFSDYMTGKRMRKAGELLGDRALSIAEVAERVGYRNMTHFHRQFRDFFGMKPGQYRKNENISK